jgi:hypothetical protein
LVKFACACDVVVTEILQVVAKIQETEGGKGPVPAAAIDSTQTTLNPGPIEATLGSKGEPANGVYKVTVRASTSVADHAIGSAMGATPGRPSSAPMSRPRGGRKAPVAGISKA